LTLCSIVLIKDFDSAKQRLENALSHDERAAMARDNAIRALHAARAVTSCVIAVACGDAALQFANDAVVDTVRDNCEGQNPAAEVGISRALEIGADAVLVLSSDLPLVNAASLRALLARVRPGALVVAARAHGRGGTNALYMSPPNAIRLQFGDDSLAKFERETTERGIPFLIHDARELGLDVDEPSDLAELAESASA
jgi:2-phospho-L-lactate guanylyltransferase